jgi:glucose-1-phosphate thymidylyltransferase
MNIILPVAGKGTRLRPHTHSKSKCLIRVAGKTVLEHILDSLHDIPGEKKYIFVTDRDNGDSVRYFMETKFPSLSCTFAEQTERLGPAHAVWLAADSVNRSEDLLIVFNDTICFTELSDIGSLCSGYDGLIFSKEVENPERFGVSIIKDGIIADMIEKPDVPVSNLAQVGLYYMKDGRRFLEYVERIIREGKTVKGEFYLPEVFKTMIREGHRFGAPLVREWLDCGVPETLLETNRILLGRMPVSSKINKSNIIVPPVFIDEDADVMNSVIGPNVSIGSNCEIRNSIIRNTIVNSNSLISDAILTDSLIGESVVLKGKAKQLNVGDNSQLIWGEL